MKIGVVIEQLGPGCGGAEQWTQQFVRWLFRQGHEVHVIARDVRDAELIRQTHCHLLNGRISKMRFAQQAEQVLSTLALDVVHDMGCGYVWDIFQPHGGSRLAAFDRGLQTENRWLRLVKRHVCPFLPRYREYQKLTVRQYGNPHGLYIALSDMVVRHFRQLHHLPAEKIRLVYNGVDTSHFSPTNRERFRHDVRAQLAVGPDDSLLLLVAHNQKLKGLPTLLRAAGRLAAEHAPIKLAVIGSRRHGGYERLAAKVLGNQRVSFVGMVPDSAPYYVAADIYVHPTFYDPCSLAVLEALASGLPVITSRYNGASELITPGLQGLVIADPANERELAEAIRRLLDRECLERMGQAARRLAEQHSLEQNFSRLLRLYGEVVGRRREAA